MFDSLFSFLKETLTDAKTGTASTKRLGVFLGSITASFIAFIFAGIVIGLSVGIPSAQFQFVYLSLINAIEFIITILTAGGTVGYLGGKKLEQTKDGNNG